MNTSKLKQLWYTPDLRKDLFFVLGILLVYRILTHIPIPGVNVASLKNYFAGNEILGLLNIFTGGGLSNFSVVMLGVGPYITASIIFQLLTMVVPRIEELSKEGERGRQKINQWTRYATVPLAILQGYGTLVFLSSRGSGGSINILGNVSTLEMITAIVSIGAGTTFLMWLGELISERKIGNGISILIFAGIISALPQSVIQAWSNITSDPAAFSQYLVFLVITLITIAAIVFIVEGQRNIPIAYARQVVGSRIYGGSKTHLPLRVNQAGMIPIIFAISIVLFPPLIAQFFRGARSSWLANAAQFTIDLFNSQIFYGIIYFLLVVGFTYFYTYIIFQPAQIAENLQKQGGFIPGVRPGKETTLYLNSTMNRIVFAGAIFLGVIAILPVLLQSYGGFSLVFSGSSMLIVVGVVIEIVKQIDSQLIMRQYET